MQNNEFQKDPSLDPCERLLDAAEKLFCEKGYEGTSVRDITAEAGCNIAAVIYHFGGKERLYQEMFRRRLVRNLQVHPGFASRFIKAAGACMDVIGSVILPSHPCLDEV